MLNFYDESVRKKATEKMSQLMDEALKKIEAGEGAAFYNKETHRFLMKHGWEILIPAEEDQWPESIADLTFDDQLSWPNMTTFAYVMCSLNPPHIPNGHLCYGYAVQNGELKRATFFVHQSMVDYQVMPQGIVFDPLAKKSGVNPDFYIGFSILSNKYAQQLLMMRKHPLENFVETEGHTIR